MGMVQMVAESVWRSWKPYAVIAVVTIAAVLWFNSQSSFASLKDGSYECTGVYVNDSGKYEYLTDDAGNRMYAQASIRDGKLVSMSGDGGELTSTDLSDLTMRIKGNTHFNVTDDHAVKMYNAVACDLEP